MRAARGGWLILVTLLVALALVGAACYHTQLLPGRDLATILMPSAADLLPRPESPVEAPEDAVFVAGGGEVDVSGGKIPLSPAVGGTIREILVKEGQRIARGTPLLTLDDRTVKALQEQADAAVEQAKVKLEQAEHARKEHQCLLEQQVQSIAVAQSRLAAQSVKVALASKRLKNHLGSSEEHQIAQEELRALNAAVRIEQAKKQLLTLDDPEQTIALARAQLASARAAAVVAREQRAQYMLAAPLDGTVLRISVGEGETLGALRSEPAIWFLPDRPWIVRCEVDQEFAERVRSGMTCDIYNDRLENPRWRGTVTQLSNWIAPKRLTTSDPLQRQDVHTMECIVTIEGDHSGLRAGQRVRVLFRSSHDGERTAAKAR